MTFALNAEKETVAEALPALMSGYALTVYLLSMDTTVARVRHFVIIARFMAHILQALLDVQKTVNTLTRKENVLGDKGPTRMPDVMPDVMLMTPSVNRFRHCQSRLKN